MPRRRESSAGDRGTRVLLDVMRGDPLKSVAAAEDSTLAAGVWVGT